METGREEEFGIGEVKGRSDLRNELTKLEALLEETRVQYEQYFVNVLPQPPDKMHTAVRRLLRDLMKAPFKNSEIRYRIKGLERRYQTYNTYWERVKRQREEGTYSRDQFKAELRARHQQEDSAKGSKEGQTQSGLRELYTTYKSALERQTGTMQKIDFETFKNQMAERAKTLREKTGADHLSFRVVVRGGKVALQAKTSRG
jgi:hypothetical protein